MANNGDIEEDVDHGAHGITTISQEKGLLVRCYRSSHWFDDVFCTYIQVRTVADPIAVWTVNCFDWSWSATAAILIIVTFPC